MRHRSHSPHPEHWPEAGAPFRAACRDTTHTVCRLSSARRCKGCRKCPIFLSRDVAVRLLSVGGARRGGGPPAPRQSPTRRYGRALELPNRTVPPPHEIPTRASIFSRLGR